MIAIVPFQLSDTRCQMILMNRSKEPGTKYALFLAQCAQVAYSTLLYKRTRSILRLRSQQKELSTFEDEKMREKSVKLLMNERLC